MVPAISLVEQRQIASALLIAEEMIRSIQEYLKSLRLEKRALMQQLLTGTRRVTV